MKNEGCLKKQQQKQKDGQKYCNPLEQRISFWEMVVTNGAENHFGIYVHGAGRAFFCIWFWNHIILKWIYE
jgi:hypothetical protein